MLDRRLEHLVVLARTGSFTKAAERVGITQSGLTKSIADLERQLGYALFYRTARGAVLTESGREFAERAGQLLDDAQLLLTQGGEKGDPYARTLRIGVSPSSLEWRLAEPLVALSARHPSVRFEVLGSGIERVVQSLRAGSIDVAVGLEEAFSDWSDITRVRVAEVQAVLFVRKGHPIVANGSSPVVNLTAFDCILPSDSRPFGNVLRELFEAAGVSWKRRLHVTDNVGIARRLVASSDAFALTSQDVAQSAGFSDAFDIVPGESLFPPFPLCCAIRSRWELSAPVKAFLREMKSVSPRQYDLMA